MRSKIPVLAVIGHKKSGKTTVIEALILELTSRGFKVAASKHISEKGFSMETKGKDTWRFSEAGANPVMAVSDEELILKMRNGLEGYSLDKASKLVEDNGADTLIIEGFSSLILKDKRVGKIICVRQSEEYERFKKKAQGAIIAFCSFQPLGEPVLSIREGLPILKEKATKFIEKEKKIYEILTQLAGLDCGKCAKATCEGLAEAIFEGQASLNDCIPLHVKPKLKTRITVGGFETPLQPFVSEIIRRSVLGMVSSLKGVKVEGDEEVRIDIGRKSRA